MAYLIVLNLICYQFHVYLNSMNEQTEGHSLLISDDDYYRILRAKLSYFDCFIVN